SQDELPAPIHRGGRDHFVVSGPRVRLQQRRQGQLCRRDGGLALRTAWGEGRGHLLLEGLVEQRVAPRPQEREQPGAAHAPYPARPLTAPLADATPWDAGAPPQLRPPARLNAEPQQTTLPPRRQCQPM